MVKDRKGELALNESPTTHAKASALKCLRLPATTSTKSITIPNSEFGSVGPLPSIYGTIIR